MILYSAGIPGDLPVPMEYIILMLNTIVMLLSGAIAGTNMPLTNVHFVAGNVTHALASTAIVTLTFSYEEEEVVIRNGWTPEEKK